MKSKKKITKNVLIGEIVAEYPKLIKVLMEKYGLHCVGCGMASMETLEMGAKAHGMKSKEIVRMIKELNRLRAVGF
jgi:hybrid cluster-associated redox disulfide protein